MNPNKICVAVRKRPVGADDKDVVITQSPSLVMNEPKIKYDLTPYTERHHFVLDEVFDERVTNRDVYMRCAQPLIDTVFNRGNATCFAYGQTGSGKTHTMLGKGDEPGLYACAAFDVLQRAQKQNMEVFASFYEIYGRKLFDLLNERAKLVCREDGDKQINICGLTEHPVARVEELLQIIGAGSNFRAAGATSANSESSRSHAVLQLEVRDRASQRSVGKLSFIDLAGNERASDTFDSDRKTRMEGAEINKSLLALKECIRALGMGKSHVPFRGSILTEVLRDSFLGNSRTTMIATISPAAANCEHTLNTLRYTSRVKELGGPPKPAGPPPQAGVVGRAAAAAAVAAMGAPPAAVKAGGAIRAGVAPDQAAAFAAMAERLAMDAAGADGGSAPSARAPLGGGVAAGAAQKPVAKVGRRAPAAAPARPAWNDDFGDESPTGPNGAAPLPPRSGRGGAYGGAGVGRVPDAALDPAVASIVQNHIQDLDELETEAGASDIDDGASGGDPSGPVGGGGAAGGNGAATRQVRAVHAHIVTRIRDSEEALLQQHRKHVDAKMALMKAEVTHMQRLDERGGIDDYVAKVDALLAKEMAEIKAMREHLSRLQTILREEEVLSQTLTGGNKRRK